MVWPLVVVCVAASFGFWHTRIDQLKHRIEPTQCGEKSKNGSEDYISRLPDELLENILSLLTIKEAVRTSVLSRRWRHAYAYMPDINLNWFVMSGAPDHDHRDVSGHVSDDCGRYKQLLTGHDPDICAHYTHSFRSNVDQFLKTYKNGRILSFELSCCCLPRNTWDVSPWVILAFKKDVEKLSLKFFCGDDFDKFDRLVVITLRTSALSKFSKLKHLRLHSSILKFDSKWMFNTLVTLDLSYVHLRDNDAQCIFSVRSSLEEVRFYMSELPSELYVGDNMQRLKLLAILDCYGLELIEVYASNIKTFEFLSRTLAECRFAEACTIENIFFETKRGGVDKIFGNLFVDLPCLKKLSVGVCSSALYQIPANPWTFWSVKTLHLFIIERNDHSDLGKALPSLLRSLPQLQKLLVVMPWSLEWKFKKEEHNLWVHERLREVEMGNFVGAEVQIRFASYLLRSAIMLERMIIDKCERRYIGFGDWRHWHTPPMFAIMRYFIFKRLKKATVSNNAKIIFR